MKILVVDDSALMRKIISDILVTDKELQVVGTACDGVDALEKIKQLQPDVVTLDVVMPRMDGLETLRQLMPHNPLPVIMLSSLTREGADTTLRALELGAFDYVLKPSGSISLDLTKVKDELIRKVKAAAHYKAVKSKPSAAPICQRIADCKKVILIGASTGGPPALEHILTQLPQEIPPILIVQHMPPTFTKYFAERLAKECRFEVKEAEEGDAITRNKVLVAPGGYHMVVEHRDKVHLNLHEPVHSVRPAVDPMMESAAKVFRGETIGVLLTGMGRDGATGMKCIKQAGGSTIAQNEETCTIFGMPKAAISEGCVDKVLPLYLIPNEIVAHCQNKIGARTPSF